MAKDADRWLCCLITGTVGDRMCTLGQRCWGLRANTSTLSGYVSRFSYSCGGR